MSKKIKVSDWEIDRFNAKKDLCSLWIANGFFFFKDEGRKSCLNYLPFWERYLIWRHFKKEIIRRSRKVFYEKPLKETTVITKTPNH